MKMIYQKSGGTVPQSWPNCYKDKKNRFTSDHMH